MPHVDRELELLAGLLQDRRSPRCSRCARTAAAMNASSRVIAVLVCTRSAKNSMSSARSSSTALKIALEERLGAVGVVVEVGEGDLRLDHPELGQVARRVGVLGAEGRAEGVDLAQRQAVRLDVELAGDGEERLACRRSPCGSRSCPSVVARQVGQVERGHAEHLARRPRRRGR